MNVKAVAMDMWPAYISTVQKNLPNAKIIFDRFHITKKINEQLKKLRTSIYREVEDKSKEKVVNTLPNLLDYSKKASLFGENVSIKIPLLKHLTPCILFSGTRKLSPAFKIFFF